MQTKRKTPPRASSEHDDPTTEYARQALAGHVTAGPQVRNACARHMRDLKAGPDRGLRWDIDAAGRIFDYFEQVLRLNGGQFEGLPFTLLDWQIFILGSLFGWYAADGTRRFRVAYVETGKGSGKSPLAAGIGLYGLTSDNEPRAEIYASATKKDQAMILFRDAVAMVEQSPHLSQRLVKSGSTGKEWNLAYHAKRAFFRPIASDDSQSGPRPHIALLDEIHEHKGSHVVEMMRAGTKSRRQALIFMITNSGTDKTSVCFDYHDYAQKVAAGAIEDDAFFGYVCDLDPGDDPFKSEDCWPKANPSLAYGIPGYKYIREQVVQARGMPAKESVVRRLNFCQWVEAANPLIGYEAWAAAEERIPIEQMAGRRCYGGLDLGSTQSLTALVLFFEPTSEDPVWRLFPFFWLPGDGIQDKADKDRVPYIAWRDAGHLQTLDGRAVDRLSIVQQLARIAGQFDLAGVAYDRWRIEDLIKLATDHGLDLTTDPKTGGAILIRPHGQGYKDMGPAVDQFERLLLNGQLRHDGNPVMTWCAANAVATTDPAGNRKLDKDRATGRIDGMVAAVMAAGMTIAEQEKPFTSIYESRGLIRL